MNLKLLYIYIVLVIAAVIMSVVVWLVPSSKSNNQKFSLQYYINIQPVQLNGGGYGFLSNNSSSEVVALTIVFKGGITAEPLNKKGIASILATMLLSGGNNPKDDNEIKNLLKQYSITINIGADLDNISFNILTTKANISHMFDILTLVLNHNNFSNNDLKVAKDNALLNLKLGEHYTTIQGGKTLYSTIFNNNPKFLNMFGTKESISSITLQDLIAAKKALLTKSNIVIGASGNISTQELEKGLNKAVAGLINGKPISFSSNALSITKKFVNIPVKGSTNSDIYIVMPMPQTNGINRFAAAVVNNLLGSGFNSLLVEEVRVKRGLVYTISSSLNDTLYGKFWLIKATTANNKVKDTLSTIKMVLTDLQKKGYKTSDISKVKQYMKNSYLLNFDSDQNIANTLVSAAILQYSTDDIYNRNLFITNVSNPNINAIIDQYINPNNLTIIVAGAKL